MNHRICMCCGEPIAAQGDVHSLNPNMCASCSSLSDGMPKSSVPSFSDFDDQMLVALDFPPVSAKSASALARS